jgi:hypothetical protein
MMSSGEVFQKTVGRFLSVSLKGAKLRETHSVPSVGIDPPTPVPSKKSAKHNHPNDGAKAEAIPKMAVRKRVRLKAGRRPCASEST